MKKKLLLALFLSLLAFGLFGQAATPIPTPCRCLPAPTPTPTPYITPPCRCTMPPPVNEIRFDSYSYTVGTEDTLSCKVQVSSENQRVAAYDIAINYDPEYLTPVNVSGSDSGMPVVANIDVEGIVSAVGFDPVGKGPGMRLSLLEIEWKTGTQGGSTSLDITVNNMVAPDYREIPLYSNYGASVKIQGCLLGDANGDGVVNIVDALMIAQGQVGLPVVLECDNNDVNRDGVTNIIDALIIAQYFVGLVPSLPV